MQISYMNGKRNIFIPYNSYNRRLLFFFSVCVDFQKKKIPKSKTYSSSASLEPDMSVTNTLIPTDNKCVLQ